MKANLAVAAAEPQPAARLAADRRSLRANSKAEDAFTAALDDASQETDTAAKDQPKTDPLEHQEQFPPQAPHFLLAAHHAAVAQQAAYQEPHPAAAKALEPAMEQTIELLGQRPNRWTAKPGHAAMEPGSSAFDNAMADAVQPEGPDANLSPQPLSKPDVMRPSQQPEILEADPGTEPKPIADRTPPATAKHDEDNQSAGDGNASLPIETPALQISGKSDATPSHQPSPPQPQLQPIAAQLAGRLAPAINQAQAILRILENAGDAGPVVKTLQFALRPRDLGEMRVTLSLGTGELSLRIETQTEDAARRLELDRSLLDTMLIQAGVAVDRSQIDIRVNRFDPQQPAASFEGAGPRGGETPASFNHDHSQRQSRSGNPHQASEGHQHASSATVGSDHRDRRSIYL